MLECASITIAGLSNGNLTEQVDDGRCVRGTARRQVYEVRISADCVRLTCRRGRVHGAHVDPAS
jgi:hypothetical protein